MSMTESALASLQSSERQKMSDLCSSFPTLRGRPGTEPWDQHTFARWASGPAPSHGGRLAAAFVLSVWNGCSFHWDYQAREYEDPWFNEDPFNVGRFDVVVALQTWDASHHEAFLAWCRDPFYP